MSAAPEMVITNEVNEPNVAASAVLIETLPPEENRTAAYTYTRADGTVEHALSAEEAIKRCPILGRMTLEQANALLELASIGNSELDKVPAQTKDQNDIPKFAQAKEKPEQKIVIKEHVNEEIKNRLVELPEPLQINKLDRGQDDSQINQAVLRDSLLSDAIDNTAKKTDQTTQETAPLAVERPTLVSESEVVILEPIEPVIKDWHRAIIPYQEIEHLIEAVNRDEVVVVESETAGLDSDVLLLDTDDAYSDAYQDIVPQELPEIVPLTVETAVIEADQGQETEPADSGNTIINSFADTIDAYLAKTSVLSLTEVDSVKDSTYDIPESEYDGQEIQLPGLQIMTVLAERLRNVDPNQKEIVASYTLEILALVNELLDAEKPKEEVMNDLNERFEDLLQIMEIDHTKNEVDALMSFVISLNITHLEVGQTSQALDIQNNGTRERKFQPAKLSNWIRGDDPSISQLIGRFALIFLSFSRSSVAID